MPVDTYSMALERERKALAERDDMATLWQQAEMGLASALAERDAAEAEVARLNAEIETTNLNWEKTSLVLAAKNAEVARLSTPPDDAEVADLVAELGEPLVVIEGYSADYVDTDDARERMGKAADAITRLSHAHAAERKLADDLAYSLKAANNYLRERMGKAADHLTRLSHAHAARRKD